MLVITNVTIELFYEAMVIFEEIYEKGCLWCTLLEEVTLQYLICRV